MKKLIKHVVYDTENRDSWTLLAEAKDSKTNSHTYLYRVSVPDRIKDLYLEYKVLPVSDEYLLKLSKDEVDAIINFWANPMTIGDSFIDATIYWDQFTHYV